MTRLELLEKVNELNRKAFVDGTGETFWTVTVLYNTIIYRRTDGVSFYHEVIEGVPK